LDIIKIPDFFEVENLYTDYKIKEKLKWKSQIEVLIIL
jgi:hypothetical protein